MNKTIITLAISTLLFGCQQETTEPKSSEVVVKTEKSDTNVDTSAIAEKDKMAYALGINMADSISNITNEYKTLSMDMEVVKSGFVERLNKKAKMSDEEVTAQFQIFQQKMQFAQQQKMQAAIAEKSTENETFLKDNLAKGFTKTESGLQYKVITAAKEGAAKPSATDDVRVSYKGTFTDGKEFDSSDSFNFSLKGGVIQGWLEGVKLMEIGSKYEFVIPPELGYGSQNRGPIPGGSILKFEIELFEVIPAEKKK